MIEARAGSRLPKLLGMATRAQARRYRAITVVLLVALTAASLAFNLRGTDRQYRVVASVVARTAYQALSAAREWNLQVGGVYVPVTKGMQPNPFLADPRRDLATREGIRLTKIDHAHMLRLYNEVLARERGIRIHITAPRPLRPQNAPDEWEAGALDRLAGGAKEEYEVLGTGDEASFRFMAPLRAEASCLACHADRGLKEGDLLGGISVSFSYLPFQNLIERRKQNIYFFHTLFFSFATLVILIFGSRLIQSVGALQDSLAHIKRLEGMLPICARCKNIRMEGKDPFDARSWVAIEKYIRERTDADFTHGLCPGCAKELYPEIELDAGHRKEETGGAPPAP